MELSINTKEIEQLEGWLRIMRERSIPFATKSAINSTAFLARKVARMTINQEMTLRNKHAQGSVRVEMAKGLKISEQESRVGSIADYMADQEFGATKPTKGKHGVRITTNFAAGQPEGQKPRTKVARGANKIRKITNLQRAGKGKNRKQRNIVAIAEAAKTKNRFVFLDLGRRKGIFKVTGRGGKAKKSGQSNRRIKLVHDLTNPSVKIPKNQWLRPSSIKAAKFTGRFYIKALNFQIDRIKK